MRPTVTVRRAIPGDAGPLIAVLAEAFLEGPVAEWLVPEMRYRRPVCFRYFRLMVHHGFEHGKVDTNADLSAVAIWYARNEAPPAAAPEYQDKLEQATGKYAPKFLLLDAMFEAHHPRIPHDYLAHMAVDPLRQNRGLGTALLAYAHHKLDQGNRPAYVVACNERSRDLYLRLGYRQGPALHPPSGAPLFWRMWRNQLNGGTRSPSPPAPASLLARSASST